MAAAQVTKMKTTLHSHTDDFESTVDLAKEYLLLRKFKCCHELCLSVISKAKHRGDEKRVQVTIERLCVVCIQALAEMDCWQEVLPMVLNVYESVEKCPVTVIQLCILLHAKVQEFSQCNALASVWLRCEDNSLRPGYERVAALYAIKVMLPRGQIVLLPQFLNACTHLSDSAKSSLVDDCEKIYTDQLKHDSEANEHSSSGENIKSLKAEYSNVEDVDETSNHPDDITSSDLSVFSHIKYYGCLLVSKLSFPSLVSLTKVAAACATLAVILKICMDGDYFSRLDHVRELWKAAVQLLKTVFSPYRPGR
ncbi:peroxisome assembly protein 26-like [Dreissena polymorpha]|uniref:Uncharacterized protein n=1 Tax=Dreissena polymorpha TaxID=45954 RepID=A0A9D4IWX9_DREPO|nr:peroxisome assembly protein 26-like [Dreissena polymorpha]KAH3787627.1 hypothetical protein DPMN_165754 [Dreissena polymorpha]